MSEEYKSKEEEYFSWYIIELWKKTFIDKWSYESGSYPLSDVVRQSKVIKLKTKCKIGISELLKGHVYTPDFTIEWNNKAWSIFIKPIFINNIKFASKWSTIPFVLPPKNLSRSCIEVKPQFSKFNSEREFKINQKWVYDKYGVYVQMVTPQLLFKNTFTPERYLLTDSGRPGRRIGFKIRSLEEFITQQTTISDGTLQFISQTTDT